MMKLLLGQSFARSSIFGTNVLASPGGATIFPFEEGQTAAKGHTPATEEGSLQDGDITVAIDGCEIDVTEPFEVTVFEPVTVTIERETYFKGVLARFQTDQAIGLFEDEENLEISGP